MATKRNLWLRGLRIRVCISCNRADFDAENVRYGIAPLAGGACGYVQPINRNMVLVCLSRFRSVEKLRSLILHEAVHVAHFYVEAHLRKRIIECTPKNGFDEAIAYAAQEVAWKIERLALGKRHRPLPFGRTARTAHQNENT
jgi:hypothetical protein